ncbi:hypothetical protein A5634_13520 [Mycobacterium asiaticum]|uniref:SnoaL-like domain-containing protein n=1 Tax=Mycobacterium asiaticum TaxID=1790 RepID=A0A1A3PD24_MYCAS|nr:nuclear transport factor 2 family protein [Mycobacterium asiaticum]OBK31595.1 hypothetical protein A5634_13520 [Mycobacterium asiaticum]
MEQWELVAREQIRDTLARYNWAGDAGRVDGLAETFCVDGVLEIRGLRSLHGRSEIAEFLAGVTGNVTGSVTGNAKVEPHLKHEVKPIVRHNVANVLFTEVTPQRALVSSYFTVFTHVGLDHFGRYRDVLVPEADTWLISHRKVSTDWAAPDSQMARG